jgi:hypothetical protein
MVRLVRTADGTSPPGLLPFLCIEKRHLCLETENQEGCLELMADGIIVVIAYPDTRCRLVSISLRVAQSPFDMTHRRGDAN